jgi:hypothetical protein
MPRQVPREPQLAGGERRRRRLDALRQAGEERLLGDVRRERVAGNGGEHDASEEGSGYRLVMLGKRHGTLRDGVAIVGPGNWPHYRGQPILLS